MLRNRYIEKGEPVVSVDSKISHLYLAGKAFTQTALEVYDHDFACLQTNLTIPHGIYDVNNNQACINLGSSHDTADFFFDIMIKWWESQGQQQYPNDTKLLILYDGGGSNSFRHYLFKEAVKKLAKSIGVSICIAHYPPYCSKYTPMEHKDLAHVTRTLAGVVLDRLQTVKELIETKAKIKNGLKTSVNIIDKIFEIGKLFVFHCEATGYKT
jgi:anion-transporting  ArsA/GET3 family ATPase